jgi:hypothetical protein
MVATTTHVSTGCVWCTRSHGYIVFHLNHLTSNVVDRNLSRFLGSGGVSTMVHVCFQIRLYAFKQLTG